eukprot:s1190_g34.t1
MSGTSAGSDERSSSLWSQLPSFDPATDDVREFAQKARFLHGVFPEKEKPNLAPRLAMLCKGTAWSQVRQLDPTKLTDAAEGVNHLLQALSAWEETSELQTFELFEKAMYKVCQKSDEATHSYTLRLQSAINDLGSKVTIQQMHAFILLRQSCLTNEDKKRGLSMTNGELSVIKIEQAMRALSTKVLFGSGEVKKKIYPANFVETGDEAREPEEDSTVQSTFHAAAEEEDVLTAEALESLVQSGDEDAMYVMQFEKDFEEMLQDIPDMQSAMVTYHEARQRIQDRRRSRHWKAECPQRKDAPREQANVAHADDAALQELPQVIIEEKEVLEAMRVLSEEIMESLRILFYMLFSMTRAVQPEEQVSEAEMNPLHQLVSEVRIQKEKISELGQIITSRFLQNNVQNPGPLPKSPPNSATMGFESWEIAEMEASEIDMMNGVSGVHSLGVGPSTFPTSSTPAMKQTSMPMPAAAAPAKIPPKIAGIPTHGRRLPTGSEMATPGQSSQGEVNNNGQIALTQATLEAWGAKVIT